MRKILPSLFFIASLVAGSSGVLADSPAPVRGLLEVSHENVKFVGGFWGPRVKIANEVTIPHALDELEKDGHVTNFDKAAGKFDGPLKGHKAFDSDLHKVLEGAFLSPRGRCASGRRPSSPAWSRRKSRMVSSSPISS